jgi:hypothetical protein
VVRLTALTDTTNCSLVAEIDDYYLGLIDPESQISVPDGV